MANNTSTVQMRAVVWEFCNEAKTDSIAAYATTYRQTSGDEKYYALLFMKMLENDNPDMLSELGDCYYQGLGVRKDIDKAVAMFTSAADNGSARADYDLGWYYFDRKEYMRAAEYLKKCIDPESGLDDSIVGRSHRCLANAYAYMPHADMHQAVHHWSIAADKYRDSFAAKKLGIWYSEVGTDHVDATKAQRYLILASEQGDSEAAMTLATFYLTGRSELGISSDFAKAEQILSPFANVRDPVCQYTLGMMYRMQKRYEPAKKHYERAWSMVETANLAAELGFVYYALDEYTAARQMLQRADSEGEYSYSDFLGRMYKEGWGGSVDYRLAKTYYEHAFRNDNMNNVFTYAEYCELLMDLGDVNAAYDVADKGQEEHNDIFFIYIKANLVLDGKVTYKISPAEAAELMEECIYHDHKKTEAHMALGNYYSEAREFRKAESHFIDAYKLGETEAACSLARLYERGGGSISADAGKAYEWFSKAAAAGSDTGRKEAACFKKGLFGGYRRVGR